jgi:hypothetical protein
VGPRTTWVDGIMGSGMMLSPQHRRLGENDVVAGSRTASRAWGQRLCGRRHHRLGSRKMATCKGVDRGWERWRESSEVDSTMMRRLQGGFDDSTGFGEVDDGVGSREIFTVKFWQNDGVSESLRGLGFAKGAE